VFHAPAAFFILEMPMTEESTNTHSADILNLRPEDLDELLTRAAERGAERALACLGLENGHAARDIRDLRGLIDAWREARRTAWQTTVKVLTTGVLAALLVGIAIKLRLMGGGQ
jgi:protein gp37